MRNEKCDQAGRTWHAIVVIYGLYFFYQEWWYILLFIGPEISMHFYLASNKTGALLYNFFHHKLIAMMIFLSRIIAGSMVSL